MEDDHEQDHNYVNRPKQTDEGESTAIDIDGQGQASAGSTIFEPQSSMSKIESSNANSISQTSTYDHAPEKKLTLFALRLAVFEKAATGLGTLGFIWATVVLLGGFAITLDTTDFWFITVILVVEGARIFSRSHELEWQHQSTWSIAGDGINSFRAIKSSSHFIIKKMKSMFKPIVSRQVSKKPPPLVSRKNWNQKRSPTRTWVTSDVPLLPYAISIFQTRNVSKFLYWLQLASATACAVLSLMKLIKHDYGEVEKGDTDKRNRKAALIIFYSLALAEASLFLLEKIYWEYMVIYCKLLDQVNKECELESFGKISIKRFFYDAYSKCVNGSIFDGLKMDMVSFAMELMDSDSPDEQLIGVRILQKFISSERFSDDTLQKIGVKISVIERLVEMLNWKDLEDEEIRLSAAEILSKLTTKKQNSLRVAGVPGAMESISSLLQTSRSCSHGGGTDCITETKINRDHDNVNYDFWSFNHLGLLILKKLSRDHENCGKIGNTRGLLPKIIDFTQAGERLKEDETVTEPEILILKRSLQVLKMLASMTGNTGKHLRKEISEIVFTVSNIRDILRYGERHPFLQQLGIEILTSLALEDDATERIGGTGGVLRELFNIFFNQDMPESQIHVRVVAGQALAMLALESKDNCCRILKLKVIHKLVLALKIPLLQINAARILRNLCAYSGGEHFTQLRVVTSAAATVLRGIMEEECKLQEVMVGLAAHVFKYMTTKESRDMFHREGIGKVELGNMLIGILKKNKYPPIKTPRMRRFAIELTITMMRQDETNIQMFKEMELLKQLEWVTETTSELESFNVFCGTVGLGRHSITIHSLVEDAMSLLEDE